MASQGQLLWWQKKGPAGSKSIEKQLCVTQVELLALSLIEYNMFIW